MNGPALTETLQAETGLTKNRSHAMAALLFDEMSSTQEKSIETIRRKGQVHRPESVDTP